MINIPVGATLAVTYEEIFVEGFADAEAFIWISLVMILVYLTAATNYNMMWCSMTDPGIVPARIWPEYVAKKYDKPDFESKPKEFSSSKEQEDFYYTKVLFVNQRTTTHLFNFTFCKTCQVWQPPRCNHCPICQTCVLELDHHCHWLGTCLGLRNYHSFYWYLVHVVLLSLYQLFFAPFYLWRLCENRKLEERE